MPFLPACPLATLEVTIGPNVTGNQHRWSSDRAFWVAARPRRGPRREGIGQDLNLVETGLRVEHVLGGAPGSRLQPNLAQLLDIEAAPLTARRQSGAAATAVLIHQDMGDTPLGAQGVRAENALLVVVAGNHLLLAVDGLGQDRVG